MESNTIEIERGSEKSFGIVFAIIFALVSAYAFWKSGEVLWWTAAIAAILLLITFIKPSILRIPNLLWFKFGMLLGAIIAPIVMALVYVTTVVPIGLFVRLSGKDLLHLELDSDMESYWIKRSEPPHPMNNQF